METTPNMPKVIGLIKKIVLGILVALGVLAILFFILLVIINWQKGGANTLTSQRTSLDLGMIAPAGLGSSDSFISNEMVVSSPALPPTAGQQDQKIIKTASLGITVDNVDVSATQIANEAIILKGFVQNSSVTENEKGQKFANLILRVPVSSFDNLITKIKSLAKLVEREDVNGQEVTEEYIDLQADLTHNQAVEAQYLELLKRAQKVEEIIAVREKLDQVQGEIERLKGRLRYLDNQTEMSTISVSISSEVQISLPAEKWQPYVVVKEAVKGLIINLQNFVNFVIIFIFWLISIIPYLILLCLIFLFVRWIYKRSKKAKQTF